MYNAFKIIIKSFLYVILPRSERKHIQRRLNETKLAFTSCMELRIFWILCKVILFPITLTLSLLWALLKVIAIWVLPDNFYFDLRYALKYFIDDISKRHLGFKLSTKRLKLSLKLFIYGREKWVSFGDKNPDKTFFVLRPYYYMEQNEFMTSASNLLFHYYRNLQHLSYAIQNGWIPVVDWQNYGPFAHGEDYPINGTTNCWEYFWNQPSEYTLEEVYQSKNVILSSRNSVDYGLMPSNAITPPFKNYAQGLAELCPKYDSLITLNDFTKEYIDRQQAQLFSSDERVLGISVRGVSYGIKNLANHPKQPKIEALMKRIDKVLEEWKIDKIYFACELDTLVQIMKDKYGEKLVSLPRLRYNVQPTAEDNPLYVPGQRYQTNLDYLTEMVLLSRCTCLMGGMSSGLRAAIIWNAGVYEQIDIFDNGMY